MNTDIDATGFNAAASDTVDDTAIGSTVEASTLFIPPIATNVIQNLA